MEFKRIITDKKLLLLILISFLLTIFSFVNDMDVTSDVFSAKNRQDYADGVVKVIDNAIYLREIVKDKVQVKKIEKTKEDFSNIVTVQVEEVSDNMLDNVIESPMPTFVVLIIGFYIIGSYIEERKKGMYDFVFATYRGRKRLAIRRQLILLAVVSGLTVLLYGTLFALNWSVNGMPSMSAPIQSFSQYEQFVYRLNVSQFLMLFILLKIMGQMCLINTAYFLCQRFNNYALGVFITIAIIAVSGLTFTTISPNSVMDILRHVNLYNIVDMSRILYSYDLYYIFGTVIECKFIMLAIIVMLDIMLLVGIIHLSGFKNGFKLPGFVIFKKYTGVFTEAIKMLFYNKGLIILGLLICFIVNDFELPQYCYKNKKSMLITNFHDCENLSLDEVGQYIDDLSKELDNLSPDDYRYQIISGNVHELKSRLEYAESFKGKYDVRVLDEAGFLAYFGYFGTRDRDIKTLILVSSLILMLSYAYSYEKKSKVIPFVNSTAKGCFKLKRDKYITTFVLIFLLDMIMFGLNLYSYFYDYGTNNINLDVANVSLLGQYVQGIRIIDFIIIGEILRVIILELLGLIIIKVSKTMSYEHTIAFLMLLCAAPAVAYISGVEGALSFSILKLTELVHLIK